MPCDKLVVIEDNETTEAQEQGKGKKQKMTGNVGAYVTLEDILS